MPSMTVEDLVMLSVLQESLAVGNRQALEAQNAERLLSDYGIRSGNNLFNPKEDGECLVVISLKSSGDYVTCNYESICAHRILIVDQVLRNKIAQIEAEYNDIRRRL